MSHNKHMTTGIRCAWLAPWVVSRLASRCFVLYLRAHIASDSLHSSVNASSPYLKFSVLNLYDCTLQLCHGSDSLTCSLAACHTRNNCSLTTSTYL